MIKAAIIIFGCYVFFNASVFAVGVNLNGKSYYMCLKGDHSSCLMRPEGRKPDVVSDV